MPGDLSNQENLYPYHYDPKYEPGTNTFDSRPLNIDQVLKAVSDEVRGLPFNKDEKERCLEYLRSKHLLNRNPGDQEVQETIKDYLKRLKTARKVAFRCLI